MLACSGGGIPLAYALLMASPLLSSIVAFIGGAVCLKMGNETVGGWTMTISFFIGACSLAWLSLL